MKTILAVLVLWIASIPLAGQVVPLGPAPDGLGEWAQSFVPLRMRATPAQDVRFEGPTLVLSQWGEIALGTARTAFLIGARADGEAHLWVDGNRDRRITPDEAIVGARSPGAVRWQFELLATPAGAEPFPYAVTVLWPVGRGYVYLLGGAPRRGEFEVAGKRVALVFVDGDLNGTFGTRDDFFAVDVDGDGVLHGEPDGHERFALTEPFTVGTTSFRISQVAPGGASVTLAPTAYVAPKPPLIPGHPAPEFRFTTFLDGRPLALSDLRGKVVLVSFWATWCEPCLNELPRLLDLYAQHRGQGFEIVGLSLDTSERNLRSVLTAKGIGWPVAFEGKSWDNTLAQLFRVYQIPTSYLLDRDGIIRFRDLHGDELARRVAELLTPPRAEAPVDVPVMAPMVGPPRPILEITVPSEVGIAIGETSSFPVTLTNTSPYDAEEIKLTVLGASPETVAASLELGTVPAFGERTANITVRPSAGDVPPGPIEVVYQYCVGDICFQIQDQVAVSFVLGEARLRGAAIPAWWLLVFIGVGLVAAMFLRGRAVAVVGLALVGLSVASLVVGFLRGQATQAWRIGSVLCMACVGIEEVRAEAPTLTQAERDAIVAFAGSADLVVFHTPWCKSCPYAKALVATMARANPRIRYELVDADQDRLRAERSGVVPSGRVVVPAIVVVQTGRVLFGTSDLTARILAALGEIR